MASKARFLALLSIFLALPAYANTISLNTISADSTINTFNSNFTTIANAVNGNIEGSTDGGSTVSNIKADSVYEINMADDANGRLRDSELLGITVDTTTSSNSFVYTGLTVADSATLASTIAAGTAYVNGYRVVKTATAKTFTASMDTYVDLSQNGTFTYSEVAVGAAAPTVAANSARLSKVTTDGTEITVVTDLRNTRIPGLIVPANYRSGLRISKDSATTITIQPGSCEINNSMLTKTAASTLTISTAGDWAGGTSLAASNTMGFVGMDSTGTLKLHTTAPAYSNYGVSLTAGKLRYSTWSSTVYRILGWFYMLTSTNIENASNIKEGDVTNTIMSNDTGLLTVASSAALGEISKVNFYNSGGNILIFSTISGDSSGGAFDYMSTEFQRSGTTIVGSGASANTSTASQGVSVSPIYLDVNRPQGSVNYGVASKVNSNSVIYRRRTLILEEQ